VEEFPATSVNAVLQVGHNTLRLVTVGMEPRAPRPDELAETIRLLEEALDAGAIGLSSGLFTPPGAFAAREEMHALGAVLRRHGAAYASHVRNEAGGVFDAVEEAIALGEACDVHVQIGHLKVSGTANWGRAAELLERIERARRRGVRVDADQYPYTTATNPLRNLLPAWLQDGGIDRMLDPSPIWTSGGALRMRSPSEAAAASASCRRGTRCVSRLRPAIRTTPGGRSGRSRRSSGSTGSTRSVACSRTIAARPA
jgi:N-acyl-D-amino-acid deacylase